MRGEGRKNALFCAFVRVFDFSCKLNERTRCCGCFTQIFDTKGECTDAARCDVAASQCWQTQRHKRHRCLSWFPILSNALYCSRTLLFPFIFLSCQWSKLDGPFFFFCYFPPFFFCGPCATSTSKCTCCNFGMTVNTAVFLFSIIV